MKKNGDFYVGSHSCYLLQYHLVLVTKYRRPVITGELKDDLLEYMRRFFLSHDCVIVELNSDRDHVHILFEAPPTICLSSFANSLKSSSSRYIRSRHKGHLARYYWKPLFWTRAWFIVTVSGRSRELVQQYIQNQGIR